LNDGTISIIVAAHNPQDTESKKLEFDLADFGMIGLQTVAPNITSLSEKVKMEILLKAITLAPRELLNLSVPVIEVGNLAEVTLFDPGKKWVFNEQTNCSKSTNSPYFGKELTGCIEMVVNGNKQWHNDLYK
ncbi:MAG: dihydroorotase, partial [Cyclobacteriaceae bacterium]|nr:dihydroorotase [Cyclobacteriaceae bacterium]